jgi:hypothetical protein
MNNTFLMIWDTLQNVQFESVFPTTDFIHGSLAYILFTKVNKANSHLTHALSTAITTIITKIHDRTSFFLTDSFGGNSFLSEHHSFLQVDRKVPQPIFKYLLMVAIQYNTFGLINAQCHCDCTTAHAGHAML